MKRTGPTNPVLRKNIRLLRKASVENKVNVWSALAELIERPRRVKKAVNVGKLERYCNDGDVVIVPVKLLGGGNLTKKITVAAVSFSPLAKEKIEKAGGKCLSIEEIIKINPEGKGIKIMG